MLPNPSPTAPDLQKGAVYDFLYVDSERVSSLYAQLFLEGTLTSVKTTSQVGSSGDQNIGTDIKVFKAEAKSTTSESQGVEHTFNTSWSIPIEVLAALDERSLIHTTLKHATPGAITLVSGYLRIIDYASMKDLWEPVMNLLIPQGENQPTARDIVGLIKSLPHTIHAHFLTEDGYLWSSLAPLDLTIPSADIVLKHGGNMVGQWNLLCVVDAYPDVGAAPNFENWSAGDATDAVLNMIHSFRMQIGRPAGWYGVTPIMIFREIPVYTGQQAFDLKTIF